MSHAESQDPRIDERIRVAKESEPRMQVWVVQSGEEWSVDDVYDSFESAVAGIKSKAVARDAVSWEKPVRHDSHGEYWTLIGHFGGQNYSMRYPRRFSITPYEVQSAARR